MAETDQRIERLTPLQRATLALKEYRARLEAHERAAREPIAVVGLSCRFPGGGDDPEAFWRALAAGVDGVIEVPPSRWDIDALYDPDPDAPGKMATRRGGFLTVPVEEFDPQFFSIAPLEAVSLDPQQRLLLEVAWEALENAGRAPDRLAGSATGVFVGISTQDYARLLERYGDPAQPNPHFATGTAPSVAAGRLSYLLGLQGPALAVDTACSSSLVALHLACRALRAGECDLALCGAVNLMLVPDVYVQFSKIRAISPAGRCATFDAGADGYVRGEGCGVLVLKRLSEALAAGDPIHAVVRGSAVNQDGKSSGLTAPNGPAQQAVIRQALRNAGVAPAEIDYVETHGSGTPLGDPIEVQALGAALAEGRPAERPVALGSVKTNLGHLEAAAGMAGLVKTILALEHRRIPPSLHFRRPNPHIPFDRLPVRVQDRLGEWPVSEVDGERRPARAGVSGFAFSGTNAHIVLEEAPPREPSDPGRPRQLLVLSARTESALEAVTDRLVESLKADSPPPLADVAYTLQLGRKAQRHRRFLVASTVEDAAAALESRDRKRLTTALHEPAEVSAAFLFPGLGDHYPDMGLGLYRTEEVFRREVDRCAEILEPLLEVDLREVLFPGLKSAGAKPESGETKAPALDLRKMLGRGGGDEEEKDPAAERLDRTRHAQPAIFVIEWALARLWMSWGIRPRALIGFSLGEYAAACVAGVLGLEDALTLVARRALLIDPLPAGAMLAVPLPEAETRARLTGSDLALAAVLGPERSVVSGPRQAVDAFAAELTAEGLTPRPLRNSHAFHSPMMEPVAAELEKLVAGFELEAPRIPYLSNLTGTWITAEEATDPSYWARHLCGTVRFAEGAAELLADRGRVLVEVGPGQTLSILARQIQEEGVGERLAVASMRYGYETRHDLAFLLQAVGRLWLAGLEPDWAKLHGGERRHRVALPTYPFERRRYWVDTSRPRPAPPRSAGDPAAALSSQEATVSTATPSPPATAGPARSEALLGEVVSIVSNLTGIAAGDIGVQVPFLEMGADSIVLVNAVRAIEEKYGVELSIRQLFEELPTIEDLVAYLDSRMPAAAADAIPHGMPAPAPGQLPAVPAMPAMSGGEGLQAVLAQQLQMYTQGFAQMVDQQLRSMGLAGTGATPQIPTAAAAAPSPAAAPAAGRKRRGEAYVPHRKIQPTAGGALQERQQRHLERLVERFTVRTATSKRMAEEARPHLADSRAVVGFRLSIKEMLYPIVGHRGKGSRVWDVDGNEYLDMTMGFGVYLWGHQPDFVHETLTRQLRDGIAMGPRADDTGEAARLLCELTGLDRAAFFNSGTEAVMTALRLARARTGREKIAHFAGSYHGHSDGTLARTPVDGGLWGVPIAPGIPRFITGNTLVLDYCEDSALEAVRAHAGELAAVIVEPVQSRHPELEPGDFLRRLRELTRELGIALILDEMICGFRLHQGGAQAYYGVRADLATYGKIVGGGVPVGVVAGTEEYMGGIDGGLWQYGDASYPPAETTFVGGTFCQHPLAMAAARAVLTRLKEEGPELQERVNRATDRLAAELNRYFQEEEVPIEAINRGSLFRLSFSSNLDLLFYHLLEKGIYIWEWRNCFLSDAHSEEDLERFQGAIRESIDELREGGFLPDKPGGGARMAVPAGAETAAAGAAMAAAAGRVPLSASQKQLWFLARVGEDSNRAYNESVMVEIEGAVDAAALGRALRGVVARHEALRATIAEDGEAQIFHPDMAIDLPLVDLSRLAGEELETARRAWLEEESRRAFDLAAGPLARAHLVRLAEGRHLLALTAHHIVVDGWSLGIVLQEIMTLYRAEVGGEPARLPEPMPWSRYLELRRQQLEGAASRKHEAYWLERFSGPVPMLELPTDRPRPPVKTFHGGRRTRRLEPELVNRLVAYGRKHRATPFMVLMAAFTALLHRLSGQREVVVAFPVAGRSLKGSETVVGFATSVVLLRSRAEAGVSLGDYLGRLRGELLSAYEHQDYPYELLLDKLHLHWDASRAPLFSVLFNLDQPHLPPPTPGLAFRRASPAIRYAKYSLSLNATDLDGRVILEFDYNSDLFDATTVERAADQLRRLLEAMAAGWEGPMARLPLLPAAERHQLLHEHNDTAAAWPGDPCLHELVGERLAAAPEATAVVFEGAHLSAAELARRADGLAGELRRLGAGPEEVVGIAAERSLEMVTGLLAILRAGAAYLPLDPSYPPERLSYMVETSGAGVVLTQKRLAAEVPEVSGEARAVLLDGPRPGGGKGQEGEAPEPSNLAYVIYTSGSTGRPKGAMNSHRAIVNRLRWMQDAYGLDEGDAVLQKTPYSFDVSVWEFFWPLITGARLVMARPGGHQDGAYLARAIVRERVTTLHFVPSMLQLFLEEPSVAGCRDLRRVIASGEALPVEVTERFFDLFEAAGTELHNLYGPTEAAVDVTAWRCRPGAETVPIGRPIANLEIHLLDRERQAVPVGVAGELHIGGVGLGRGYHRRPALTAGAFVPHPLSEQPGARLYRTGDLARRRPAGGGEIEFLGRVDFQVKIRGFRIELGEIEAALAAHPAVSAAVVTVYHQPSGDDALAAYLAADPQEMGANGGVEGAEARASLALARYLKERLPEYMVPAAFVFLERLPLNANGKVDRKALPAPQAAPPPAPVEFVAPANELERSIVEVLQEVFGAERIGVRDNFFDLGGTSFHMARLQVKLKRVLEREVSVIDLFSNPNAQALARFLRRRGEEDKAAVEVAQDRARRKRAAMGQRRPRPSRRLRA